MMAQIDFQITCRVRRMRLARLLMRLIGVVGRCLPRSLVERWVRAVVCKVAVFELQIGDQRWQRVPINPDEVQFA
jgi:hypothetical protein